MILYLFIAIRVLAVVLDATRVDLGVLYLHKVLNGGTPARHVLFPADSLVYK